jgi:pyruvate ferredoxin oxidoreductase gamma subunit
MRQIRLHGRGGQGGQQACQILADAFFRGGAWVQAFAAYGGERRGAPVTASLRIDDRPIRLRCDVERADCLIVLEASLLDDLDPGAVGDAGLVLVNSPAAPCGRRPDAARLVAVDATAIAEGCGLGPLVSTAMLGAFAGATGQLALDDLRAAVARGVPARARENVRACEEGYHAAAQLVGAER